MTTHDPSRVRQLVIGSAFRNSTPYLTRYFTQVARLKACLGDRWYVRVVAAEGDSADDTRNQICHVAGVFDIDDCTIVNASHGLRWFGSTEEHDRMAALSKVGNAILDSVSSTDDVLLYVESDLVWTPYAIAALIESLTDALVAPSPNTYDSVSPLVFAGGAFYDIWGFRGKDGQRYSPFPPYHTDLVGRESDLVEVSSAGSCLIMDARVARDPRCRMTDGALVEFCANARLAGYRFAVNPTLRINHP